MHRRRAFHESDHDHPQHCVVGVLLVGRLRHVRGQRADHAVAQQDSKKRPHQRRRDFVPDFLRRPAQRPHRDHHAQHGRHDPQAGKGIRHRAERRYRLVDRLVVHLHVEIHHLVDIERIHASRHRHPHRVADKVARMMVLREERILVEDRALLRLLDVRLQRHQSFVVVPC